MVWWSVKPHESKDKRLILFDWSPNTTMYIGLIAKEKATEGSRDVDIKLPPEDSTSD